ncbi:SCO family protein [Seongchinamella sediminis]|uniref:SCO family protein n=1 Tax=Seongchinamella sediminis TaxID=2283635 RepID=A0A3L7DXV6_9GAMM|nr:SCO family protein [Seongchinamella sediminis]RLQ21350.1 SCO family protein [Seongchinamella sediminis]
MQMYLRPAIAGLLLSLCAMTATAESELGQFSRDEALAYSQAAIGNTVSGIELLAADGSPVQLEDYRGKPLVVSLIFTSCHHICPTTTRNLDEVVSKARDALDDDSFNVVTVGFDTANDSPARMRQFRKDNAVEDPRWDFLAGSEQQVEALVQQLGFIYTPSSRGFDHLIQASVLDADGRVYRQIYGIEFPTPHLIEPLKDLVFGRPREQSALDYLGNRIRLFCTVYDPATDRYYIDISVFIGTFVGVLVSIIFGWALIREWRRSLAAGKQ